ncbi:MAG: alpha/beta fold hydrolase [Alphaproteobacteria bacterium]|nr:alpha/beta fold hydrolase [Alphaproteobacteria bacterium]
MASARKSTRRFALPALILGGMAGNAPATEAGAWPNIPFPTLGGKQFWTDRYLYSGWRIQENVITGHSRLLNPDNVRRCWGAFAACRAVFDRIRAIRDIEAYNGHLVILVHGLGRSRASFGGLERALTSAGYQVAAISYASTRRSVARNAADLNELIANLEGVERISFVTHSLGGLVVRGLLAREAEWRERIEVNALIMTAPPSRGSVMADVLQYVPPINLILWRGLFDSRTSAVASLPSPNVPFAIIAAGRGGTGWNPILKGDDDLIVSVEETRLDGAAGWMKVDGIHSFIMPYPDSIKAAIHFLEYRRFEPPA